MSKKKTQEEFVKEVFDLVSNEYEVLGDYENALKKIKMKHVECGHKYEATPHNFLQGNRCPKCFGKFKKTTKIFKKEVFDLVGGEYEVLGKHVAALKKIKMKHVDCGFEWGIMPSKFLQGRRCPKCAGNIKKTTEIFKKEVLNIVGNEYEILGKYTNTRTKIKMKHVDCGHEYEATPHNFLRGNRCPNCCNSKGFSRGEKELVNFIKSFYSGTVIENDRTVIHSMTTDKFYELDVLLPELNLAIEYNGKYWHDLRELETPGYHNYKQKVCDEKGIKLINICDDEWKDETKQKEIKRELSGWF